MLSCVRALATDRRTVRRGLADASDRQPLEHAGGVEAGVPDLEVAPRGEARASRRGTAGPSPATIARRSLARRTRGRAPAITMLAASRFTSHSHGPGRVSSKSLMSKTSRRSGEAKPPKFARCASPHSWASSPESGVGARSAAMIAAAPRKKANGEVAIRPWRIGTSSATREASSSSSIVTGSGRAAEGAHDAWLDRGLFTRAARPAATRCSTVSCACVVPTAAVMPSPYAAARARLWAGRVRRLAGSDALAESDRAGSRTG